jgi:integrase
MPRKQQPVRVERGLYRAGKTYLVCASPPGSGRKRWKTLGEVGLMQARSERDAWAVEVRSGGVATTSGRETVEEVALAWLAYVERLVAIGELRPRTLESYRTGVMLHLLPQFGHRRVRSITTEDLVEWHRRHRASGASVWSIRARWMAIRGVFGYAARHGIIPASPADKLLPRERPAAGEARQRFLSREEMDSLLGHAGDARAVLAIALFTGMRVMEVLALTWGDIDFSAGVIRVRFQLSRQGKRVALKTRAAKRDIVLMTALARLLRRRRISQRYSTDSEFIFQSAAPRQPMTYKGLLKLFHGARESAALGDVTFHALRHTFASILIAQGHDVQFVSRQLGHTKTSTTWDTYVHLFEAQRHAQDARTQLDADYGGLLGGSSDR